MMLSAIQPLHNAINHIFIGPVNLTLAQFCGKTSLQMETLEILTDRDETM
jgi:hypothetical protein